MRPFQCTAARVDDRFVTAIAFAALVLAASTGCGGRAGLQGETDASAAPTGTIACGAKTCTSSEYCLMASQGNLKCAALPPACAASASCACVMPALSSVVRCTLPLRCDDRKGVSVSCADD